MPFVHSCPEPRTETPTTIGRSDASHTPDIILSDVGIEPQHCAITRSSGALTLTVFGDSTVYVNGHMKKDVQQLHHQDRLVLGNNHVFIVSIPGEEGKEAEGNEAAVPDPLDYNSCMMEVNRDQLVVIAAQEAKLREEAEMERQKAEDKVGHVRCTVHATAE